MALVFGALLGGGLLYYYFFIRNAHDKSKHPPTPDKRPYNNREAPRNRYQECMICKNDMNEKDLVRLLLCLHLFHKKCIDEWRLNGSWNVRTCCPICGEKNIGHMNSL